MKIVNLVLTLSLVSSSAFGVECKQAVSLLGEGTAAPCSGWLYSPDAAKDSTAIKLKYPLLEQERDEAVAQRDAIKKQLTDEEAIAEDQRKKSELWRTQAYDATQKYFESQNSRGTRDALFFGGGVLTVLFLIWLEGQAQQARNR